MVEVLVHLSHALIQPDCARSGGRGDVAGVLHVGEGVVVELVLAGEGVVVVRDGPLTNDAR